MHNSKKNNFKIDNRGGFLLVEVLVVSSILVVSIIAVLAVAQKSITVSRQALATTSANFLLEEGAEAVRIYRDNGWSNITSLSAGAEYYPTFSGGTWILSTTPNTVEAFTRKVVITNVNRDNSTSDIVTSLGTNDLGTKLVTVTVSWNNGGILISKTLSFYILDIFS